MSAEEQRVQRNSGYTGTVGTEEQSVQWNRGTVGTEKNGNKGSLGTEEQWVQRKIGNRGALVTEVEWGQRTTRCRGTVGTENTCHSKTAVRWDKRNTEVVIYIICAHKKNLPSLKLKCKIKSKFRPCIEVEEPIVPCKVLLV